ncbi:unnamed protein product [Linum tenue]|uniref:YqaJ viral recombinase domain-containing protein n=1 Tax=Linum tenue TaxID=586396 RepID=A0AAV0LTI8_9ROSI|nr:unnamed protein product [Linum tenue]
MKYRIVVVSDCLFIFLCSQYEQSKCYRRRRRIETVKPKALQKFCCLLTDFPMELVLNRIHVSSPRSRASLSSVNVKALSFIPLPAEKKNSSNQKFLSVCGYCRRGFHQNRVTANSLILFAMTNNCITRVNHIHHKRVTRLATTISSSATNSYTNLSSCRFFTCSPPLISRTPSFKPLVLSACITQSDAPQRSEEWFALRKDKLTTSTFSTALGFWKGKRRPELWHEKVFAAEVEFVQASKNAMEWGVLNESLAIERYRSITGREVSSLGFAVHAQEKLDWLGASPDGLLGCFPEGGILEVKCPYNKGKPEQGLPWSTMPFYYMPQVQGQLEIMDREWADLYCWMPNGSTIFRVPRDRDYWELMCGMLKEFWWENVIPAREALEAGKEREADSYMPASTHKQTGLAISKSIKLAAQCKLQCREIAGHVEFFR